MEIGIVGLPNVGKSALFNALTGSSASSQNYPFCTVEPNISVVSVYDKRLESLARIYETNKITYASVKFVDIAGLIRGASRGDGLGNKFLANIREVDAIVHVVRCFENSEVVHVSGKFNPLEDIETVNLELILADIETAERKIEKLTKLLKSDKNYESELERWHEILKKLQKGIPARILSGEYFGVLNFFELLTAKPVIYVGNISESSISNIQNDIFFTDVKNKAKSENTSAIAVCAEFEAQISQLPPEDRFEFMSEAGLKNTGLNCLISVCYNCLGLISFLTAGKPEVRAWSIKKGTKAPQAAGKIHSDMERGFIRADIVSFENLIKCGSLTIAREKGYVSSEGKDYVMRDGDVALFKFNV
ncbi:MAG: redox-regulated ATPase YchF [Oscillospiraceae bacterium]|jgi:GTP-binding protein YchF|nr:redox-regulated ATPase YchF [Oscillospiraceae bacterium]